VISDAPSRVRVVSVASGEGPAPVWDPDEVTPQWIEAVLDAAGALGPAGPTRARVVAVDGTQIGTGQVGCNVRFAISYDRPGPGPASVVAKFASRSPESRAAGIATLTYETEVAFYRDLAGTVAVSRPDCLYAAVEPGTANVVLVLEDVGGTAGDQLAGCSPAEAQAAVVEAARLHGPRWGDPELRSVPWLAAKQAAAFEPGPAVAMMWPGFLDRYRDRLSGEALEVGERLSRASTWLDPDPGLATVCHCDFRLDNMLFGGMRPLTVVDWQTVQLGHGVSDVSYFVSAAMAPERRRAEEPGLVEAYHRTLSEYGVRDYPLERCWDDYRRHSFGGFFMAVFASMVVGRTERGDAMFITMANGAPAQVVDLDAFGFLR
jgi:hypothetical protein